MPKDGASIGSGLNPTRLDKYTDISIFLVDGENGSVYR